VGINLFHSPANDGTFTTDPLVIPAGPFTLNLWATPSQFVFALNPMNFTATGGITINLPFTSTPNVPANSCQAATGATCGGASATAFLMGWADDTNGSNAGVPIKLGTIQLTNAGGLGTLNFTGGAGVDVDTVDITLDPNTVLSSIPEPGTLLLLGAGLTGLVLQGSRRREN
jgi:hypothetical protein